MTVDYPFTWFLMSSINLNITNYSIPMIKTIPNTIKLFGVLLYIQSLDSGFPLLQNIKLSTVDWMFRMNIKKSLNGFFILIQIIFVLCALIFCICVYSKYPVSNIASNSTFYTSTIKIKQFL